jgi:hypothetical protein
MTHYFRTRGFVMQRPMFPLVAVVFGTQREFRQHAVDQGIPGIDQDKLGFYSLASNRIYLFDLSAGRPQGPSWLQNMATVIHEAAHQTAYNTGVHNRFCPAPAWVAEGLATMFESPGVHDARRHPREEDRVHPGQLAGCRRWIGGNLYQVATRLIAGDRLFETQPDTAYAAAWAMSFYLAERDTARYARYLKETASYPPLHDATPAQRLADFRSIFGQDLRMFAVRVQRFLDELPGSPPTGALRDISGYR